MADISKIQIESGTYNIKDAYLREKAVQYYNTLSSFKSSTVVEEGQVIKTLGYFNLNDGGSGLYLVREKTVNDVVDDITIIGLTDNTLVGELIDDVVNVKQFGAKGDGVTDDIDAINKALAQGKSIVFPEGSYAVSEKIDIDSDNIIIYGNNSTIIPTHQYNCFDVNGDNVTINELNIDGTSNYGYNINGSYCKIKNLTISNTLHSAIMLIGSHNIVDGVTAIECGWDCVSNYGDASYNTIQNSNAIRTKRHGFSTDPTTSNISFINCYCENVGNPSLDEGHSCFHFEHSNNGLVNNCHAVYDNAHAGNTAQSTSSRYVGVRIYYSDNVIVDNFRLDFKNTYAPLNASSVLNCENSNNAKIINSSFINNSSSVNVGYIYTASYIMFMNCKMYNVYISEQDGYAGQVKMIKDCDIEITTKPNFANFKYLLENAIIEGNKFKGHANLDYFISANFMNCIIKDNIFDTGKEGIRFSRNTSNASDTSKFTRVEDCTFKDCTAMINYIYGTAGTNYVNRCLFTGTCDYVVKANYNWFYMTNCFKNNLTVNTEYAHTAYFTLFNDLQTQFDYVCKALNPSNARYKISVNAGGQVIATAE